MKKIYLLLLCFCVLNTNLLTAQHFTGFEGSPFAGLYGIDVNPTSIVGSPFRFELNLGSASGSMAGKNIGFDAFNFDKFYPTLDRQGVLLAPAEANGRFLLRGLSTAFQAGKSAFAITFDIRGMGYTKNLTNDIYQFMESSTSKSFRNNDQAIIKDFELGSISWGEVGLAFGRRVFNSNSIEIKAAGRLKIHAPLDMTHIEINSLEMDLTDPKYIHFKNADLSLIEFEVPESVSSVKGIFDSVTENISFGGDVGLSLEYRPNFKYLEKGARHKYKYKLGLSLIDVGKLKNNAYKGVRVQGDINTQLTYTSDDRTLGATVIDLRKSLSDKTTIDNFVALPTSVKLQFDYQIFKGLYINTIGVYPLPNKDFTMDEIASVTVTPRLDTKRFSLFVPIIYDRYRLNFGFGMRAGPIVFGLRFPRFDEGVDTGGNLSGFAGVRIGIFKKNKKETPKTETEEN